MFLFLLYSLKAISGFKAFVWIGFEEVLVLSDHLSGFGEEILEPVLLEIGEFGVDGCLLEVSSNRDLSKSLRNGLLGLSIFIFKTYRTKLSQRFTHTLRLESLSLITIC